MVSSFRYRFQLRREIFLSTETLLYSLTLKHLKCHIYISENKINIHI